METTNETNTWAQVECTAFAGARRIASGKLLGIAGDIKAAIDRDPKASLLVFDDATGNTVEVDLRGSIADVLARVEHAPRVVQPVSAAGGDEAKAATGPGRPKLGVVAREVTLLPRHWEWLAEQPGGASVALRKLVEAARRAGGHADEVRRSQEAAYRFLSAMAGDRPGFEETSRALFAGNKARFDELAAIWPVDIRDYAAKLAAVALGD